MTTLCFNEKVIEKLQSISPGHKAAFTREYNKHHDNKDGFTRVGVKKVAEKKGRRNQSDSEEFDSMLDEEELLERRKGRATQK